MAEEITEEQTDEIPIPAKPLSGGVSGMPSWSDYMKQLEQEGGSDTSSAPTVKKPLPKKTAPAKKAAAPPAVLSEEEEEKKRIRKEQEEKRRQEMKALMAKKKQETTEDPTTPQSDPEPQSTAPQQERSVTSSSPNEDQPVQNSSEQAQAEEPIPPPKPLSGGVSGMPSWSDYLKQLDEQGGAPEEPKQEPKQPVRRPPAKKTTAPPVLSEEEEEKKRLKKEQEEKRRQEMKELMAKKKQDKTDVSNQPSEEPAPQIPVEQTQTEESQPAEPTPAPPKPLSGGVSGMPSWSDYLKQLDEQGGAPEEPKQELKQPIRKPPAKKTTAPPVLSEEEEEKKRLKKEQEEKRRQEMKELMAKKKQDNTASATPPSETEITQVIQSTPADEQPNEEAAPITPKPLSGGVSGMPSWSDYLKQLDEQGVVSEETKQEPPKQVPKKVPAKKAATPPVLSEEEEEKKRLKKEQEEKRRQEMKALMTKKKQEKAEDTTETETDMQSQEKPDQIQAEKSEPTPTPSKPLSGGVSGMPSWSDYLKQLDEQGGAPEEQKEEPKQEVKKIPAKKAAAPPVLSEEEEEKKRIKKEQEEKRRQEMKALMAKKKQDNSTKSADTTNDSETKDSKPETPAQIQPTATSAPTLPLAPAKASAASEQLEKPSSPRSPAQLAPTKVVASPVSLPTPSPSLSLLAKIPPSRTYQAATVQDIALTLNSFKDNSINFDEVFASDRSVENPKYSKKDMIEVKKMISEQAQEELTLLAKKLVDIKNKYQQETIERERIRDTISRQEKILEVLPGLVEKLNQLKRNLIQKEKQFADLKTSFDQMRKTNDSLVQNEALMKDDILKTQKAIEYSREQFASIKLTAEKKLEASNKEIILLREQNEIGKFMVNSKILKEQQNQASLKARLGILENDNTQLLNLCDSIMQKIDTFNQQKQIPS